MCVGERTKERLRECVCLCRGNVNSFGVVRVIISNSFTPRFNGKFMDRNPQKKRFKKTKYVMRVSV